jgi:hypothetical protein
MFSDIYTYKFLSVHESCTAFDQYYYEQIKVLNVGDII